MDALGVVCPYSANDVITSAKYFCHFVESLPVERCKVLFRALVVILWVQYEYQIIDFEELAAGFPVILRFVLLVRGDYVVHFF